MLVFPPAGEEVPADGTTSGRRQPDLRWLQHRAALPAALLRRLLRRPLLHALPIAHRPHALPLPRRGDPLPGRHVDPALSLPEEELLRRTGPLGAPRQPPQRHPHLPGVADPPPPGRMARWMTPPLPIYPGSEAEPPPPTGESKTLPQQLKTTHCTFPN